MQQALVTYKGGGIHILQSSHRKQEKLRHFASYKLRSRHKIKTGHQCPIEAFKSQLSNYKASKNVNDIAALEILVPW